MKHSAAIIATAVLVSCIATSATAQPSVAPVTPIVPVGTLQGTFSYAGESPLAHARRLAANNDVPHLRAHFKTLLKAICDAGAPLPANRCDLNHNAFRVSFVGQLPAAALGIVSVIVDDVEEGPVRLHGISGAGHPLLDVFLSDDPASKETKYSSTTDTDPLATNALAFASAVLGKLTFPSSTNVIAHGPEHALVETPAAVLHTLIVSATVLRLPQARATIKFEDAVALPVSAARMQRWADELAVVVNTQIESATPAPDSCFSTLNLTLRAAMAPAIAACAAKPDECAKAVKAEVDSVVSAATGACAAEAATLIGQRYTALATILGTTLTASTSIPNVPATHLTFGVATARLSEPTLENGFARAKVGTDQKYITDPLNRALLLGTINWMVPGRRLEDPWYHGIVGVFGGFALTPYFGPAAGVTVMIPKVPISLVYGYTRLLIDQIEITQLGQAGPDINTANPLKSGWAHATFFGAAYVFSATK